MNTSERLDPANFSSNVIPAHHVQIVKPASAKAAVCARPQPSGPCDSTLEPRVSVIKDGDTVRAIEVVCSCGEVIRLECQY